MGLTDKVKTSGYRRERSRDVISVAYQWEIDLIGCMQPGMQDRVSLASQFAVSLLRSKVVEVGNGLGRCSWSDAEKCLLRRSIAGL